MMPTKENNSILAGGEFYMIMLQTELQVKSKQALQAAFSLPAPPERWTTAVSSVWVLADHLVQDSGSTGWERYQTISCL